jgi:type IV fimbrial biogenesis protein FimT
MEQFHNLLGVQERRNVLKHRAETGVSLIELLVGIAVLAIMLGLAAPTLSQFLQNTQLRSSAESMVSGLNFAKAEAVRRNANVRFQLFDNLTSACSATANGGSWVVSLDDAEGQCNAATAETAAPRILQRRSGDEGSPNVDVVASGGPSANNLIIFNGLGRPVTANNDRFTQLDVTNPVGGQCEHVNATSGKMRCLRLLITAGGDVRMCDPKVSVADDPRKC